MSALLIAQEFAGATNFQVVACQGKACAEI